MTKESKYGQKKDTLERLRKGDKIKFQPFGWPVTVNEVHAVKYGVIGLPVGLLYLMHPFEAIIITVSLISFSFGLRLPYANIEVDRLQIDMEEQDSEKVDVSMGQKWPPLAILTIRHEPHYFIFGYLLSFAIGVIGLDVIPL